MPNATRRVQRNRSLLEIALALHTTHTGSSDPVLGYKTDLRLLKFAINKWETPSPFIDEFHSFDERVLDLINAVVKEVEGAIIGSERLASVPTSAVPDPSSRLGG